MLALHEPFPRILVMSLYVACLFFFTFFFLSISSVTFCDLNTNWKFITNINGCELLANSTEYYLLLLSLRRFAQGGATGAFFFLAAGGGGAAFFFGDTGGSTSAEVAAAATGAAGNGGV